MPKRSLSDLVKPLAQHDGFGATLDGPVGEKLEHSAYFCA